MRLYVDQQRVREQVQQKTEQDTLNVDNVGETNQTDPGDLVETESAFHEKVDESYWTHQNMSSAAETETIDMSDLDSSKRASCGFIKCYFRSKADSQGGYVVAPTSRKTAGRLKSLTKSWKFAEQLRRDHGIKHFLLAPPTDVLVTKELSARLNENLWNERTQRPFRQNLTRFRKGSTVIVQKVKAAPRQRLLIGCARPKLRVIHKQIHKFALKVKDKEAFACRFNETFTQVRDLLLHEPCLIYDFQVFIDTMGNIYHLDIDRCFNAKTTKKKNVRRDKMVKSHWYKSLDKIEQTVYQALKKSKKRS